MGRRGSSTNGIVRRRLLGIAVVTAAAVAVPGIALAHVERASYWPDPAPDTSVNPPAGGAVPDVRPLDTALDASQPGDTRVVCKGGAVPAPKLKNIKKMRKKRKAAAARGDTARARALSRRIKKAKKSNKKKLAAWQQALNQNPSMQALDASLAGAVSTGYVLRSSQPRIRISQLEAQRIRNLNAQLLARCQYDSIQAAVTDSHNNDRVEIMPGVYTEPASRAAPTHDPACKDYVETNDHGATGALSYKYQYLCPNDQNLIAVMGRALTDVTPPQPPLVDRHGIPDAGPCIRCNVQLQGTGVGPDDVVIDGGDPALGDHGNPADANGDQPDYSKDNGIRGDRADGLVVTNLKVRHFNENGIYITESDGWHLDRIKAAYNKEYGQLSFVSDHALIENCDTWGSGDSGFYPGASADTGDAVPENQRRYNTEVRNCDTHHNAAGYSATDGNAIWIHDNEFYDNTLGFTTDVFTAPGHPGFPADSQLIENNNFHSNNFNLYLPLCGPGQQPGPYGPNQGCSDVIPTVPEPVGTGLWVAGGNHMIIRNNRFWDNWRRGIMIFAVPDQFVCGPAGIDPTLLAGCDPTKVPPSTSYNNHVYGNKMGQAPDGSKAPNGLDFWWDQYLGNTGNCWYDNTGKNGDRASVTADPPLNPLAAGTSLPGFLPEDCGAATNIGTGNALKEEELLGCLAAFTFDVDTCDWFRTPAKP